MKLLISVACIHFGELVSAWCIIYKLFVFYSFQVGSLLIFLCFPSSRDNLLLGAILFDCLNTQLCGIFISHLIFLRHLHLASMNTKWCEVVTVLDYTFPGAASAPWACSGIRELMLCFEQSQDFHAIFLECHNFLTSTFLFSCCVWW